jgi:hypothetical protein
VNQVLEKVWIGKVSFGEMLNDSDSSTECRRTVRRRAMEFRGLQASSYIYIYPRTRTDNAIFLTIVLASMETELIQSFLCDTKEQ